MKKNEILLTLTLVLSLFTTTTFAQVAFRNESLDDCLIEAKKTGKNLFIVASATWCGPCKKMQETVFNDPQVGEFINKYYVAKKYYLDKADPDHIEKDYKISSYPTMILLDSDKKLLQSIKGASTDPKSFITRIQSLLDSNNSVKWNAIIKEHPEKTIEYANYLLDVEYNTPKADSLVFNALKIMPPSITFSPSWISYYKRTIISPSNTVMQFIFNNENAVRLAMGEKEFADFMKKKGVAFVSRNTNNRFYSREKFDQIVAEVERHPMLKSDFLSFAKENINIIEKGDFDNITKNAVKAIKETNDIYSKNAIIDTVGAVGVLKNNMKKSDPKIILFLNTIIKNEKNNQDRESFIKIRDGLVKVS